MLRLGSIACMCAYVDFAVRCKTTYFHNVLKSTLFYIYMCFITWCLNFIYMGVLSYDVWEYVGDFMHVFYDLGDFICICLYMYWVKLDLIKLLNPLNLQYIYILLSLLSLLTIVKIKFCNDRVFGINSSTLPISAYGAGSVTPTPVDSLLVLCFRLIYRLKKYHGLIQIVLLVN